MTGWAVSTCQVQVFRSMAGVAPGGADNRYCRCSSRRLLVLVAIIFDARSINYCDGGTRWSRSASGQTVAVVDDDGDGSVSSFDAVGLAGRWSSSARVLGAGNRIKQEGLLAGIVSIPAVPADSEKAVGFRLH